MALKVEEVLERVARQQLSPTVALASAWVAGMSRSFTYTAPVAIPQTLRQRSDEEKLRSDFGALVKRWKRETALISSITKTAMHESYQEIIGMGPKVLPLIFEELARHGGHWFWALQRITRENPASGCSDFEQARSAWLAWWKFQRRA